MAWTLRGQKPAVLDHKHTTKPHGSFDPMDDIRSAIIGPLLDPLPSGNGVAVVDRDGNMLGEDDVLQGLIAAIDENPEPDIVEDIDSLLGQALVHYAPNSNLLVNDLYINQTASSIKLPMPSTNVIYGLTSDVIPSAKALLANMPNAAQEFFTSLAFVFKPNAMGYYFRDEDAFESFKQYFGQLALSMSGNLSSNTKKSIKTFQGLKLDDVLEAVKIRNDITESIEEYSFARVLVSALSTYESVASPDEFASMPFSAIENFIPTNIVFANVEHHARFSPTDIANAWQMFNKALSSPINVLSGKQIANLMAVPRNIKRVADNLALTQQKGMGFQRGAPVAFRKTQPTSKDISKDLQRIVKRMKKVNMSKNIRKTAKKSYLRPNRRNPDDFNLQGMLTTVTYYSDIHLYIDRSGSVSEENYQETVIAVIKLAKKLNVDLYVNFFSHFMTTTHQLKVRNRSTAAIWKSFQKIPKISGGTDFRQVWDYIEASSRRRDELSVIITDFGWTAPALHVKHPKNLYYAPISATNSWQSIARYAMGFARSMRHINPAVHKRFLGMNA